MPGHHRRRISTTRQPASWFESYSMPGRSHRSSTSGSSFTSPATQRSNRCSSSPSSTRAGLPRPTPVLEITATEALPVRVLSFLIEPAAVVAGSRVEDLPMPDGADILLLVRDGKVLPVRGWTMLEPGDHVHLLIAPEQIHAVALLFGLREED